MKPLLRWVGGKQWLLPTFADIAYQLRFDWICEPFAGGLGISFGMEFPNVLAADVNIGLINFYSYLKQGGAPPAVSPPPVDKARYNRVRAKYNEPWAPSVITDRAIDAAKAKQFYFLNRHGFNGLYRVNKSGRYNTPWGQKTQVEYPDFAPYTELMKNWVCLYDHWLTTIDTHVQRLPVDEHKVLLFIDPPYDGTWTDYALNWNEWQEQQNLAGRLHMYRGPVIACNTASMRVTRLYRDMGFNVEIIEAPSRVGRCQGSSSAAKEMIAWKGAQC